MEGQLLAGVWYCAYAGMNTIHMIHSSVSLLLATASFIPSLYSLQNMQSISNMAEDETMGHEYSS